VPPGDLDDEKVGLVLPVFQPNVQRVDRYARGLLETIEPAHLRIELDMPREGETEALDVPGVEVNAASARRGKGQAIMDGFEALDTDILAFADADASTSVGSVHRIVQQVAEGDDVAVGSRRHPEADVEGRSALREVLSSGLVVLAHGFFDVRLSDYQCGAKALRREVWDDIGPRLTERGFAWDMELLVAADRAGYGIEEVPVEWSGESRSSVSLVPAIQEFSRALVSIRRRSPEQGEG
jgi:glycosyltransferase involved in cell wall biosynthesis